MCVEIPLFTTHEYTTERKKSVETCTCTAVSDSDSAIWAGAMPSSELNQRHAKRNHNLKTKWSLHALLFSDRSDQVLAHFIQGIMF